MRRYRSANASAVPEQLAPYIAVRSSAGRSEGRRSAQLHRYNCLNPLIQPVSLAVSPRLSGNRPQQAASLIQ